MNLSSGRSRWRTGKAAYVAYALVLSNDRYFITVQWITRPSMQGKVTTHREADLYKLAYRSSSLPITKTEGRGGLSPSDQASEESASAES